MKQKTNRFVALLLALALSLSVVLTGCSTPAQQDSQAEPDNQGTSSETTDTKLTEDYYAAANAGVLQQHSTETNWNWFYDLMDKSYAQQKEIIQSAASDVQSGNAAPGTPEYKLGSLYLLAADTQGRNEDGMAPFDTLMQPVMDAKSIAELMDALADLRYHYGLDVLINANVLALDHSAGEYTAQIDPLNYFVDVTEFQDTDAEMEADTKDYFMGYLGTLLTAAGKSDDDAGHATEQAFSFVQEIAKSEKDSAEYRKLSMEEMQSIFSNIDFERYVSRIYKTVPTEFNVKDTSSLKKLNEYLTDEHLQLLKDYIYMINLKNYAPYLGETMVQALSEAEVSFVGDDPYADREKTAVEQVNALLKWDLGKLYTEKNFTQQEKSAIHDMVRNLLDEYALMIKEKDWLTQETKDKALLKLEKLNVRIGMPENIQDYLSAFTPVARTDGGSYLSNVLLIQKEASEQKYDRFGTPVDRTYWNVTPQEMSPCYYPTDNSIYIPVAALEAPYFSLDASEEENLGAIGTIIGHEITHAFDDLGRMYDEKGDYVNWWTESDVSAFEERAQKIVDYYTAYKTSGVPSTDGKMTLGENIADLGSMHCLTRVVEKKGLDAKKFFESFARSWASITDDISASLMAGMDEHAPDKTRVNAVLSSCELFYKTYEVKEGDGMYIASENRVALW